MKYFVIAHDGKKYGPADADTLTQWASEGRITPATELEEELTGRRLMARDVDGIILSESATQEPGDRYDAPSQATTTQSNPYASSGPQSSYGSPNPPSNPFSNPPTNYPRGQDGRDPSLDQKVTNAWILIGSGFFLSIFLGFCCGFLNAIALIPIGIGVYMANDAKSKGNAKANAAFIAGIVALALALAWTVLMVFVIAAFMPLFNEFDF